MILPSSLGTPPITRATFGLSTHRGPSSAPTKDDVSMEDRTSPSSQPPTLALVTFVEVGASSSVEVPLSEVPLTEGSAKALEEMNLPTTVPTVAASFPSPVLAPAVAEVFRHFLFVSWCLSFILTMYNLFVRRIAFSNVQTPPVTVT